ncbi:hypothetical protein DFH09DRAFT_1029875 [Mycena vulgaris]|nr:hypothetical protein DFH09DRAFT_1029875 [Mycena vulgaris]
MSDPSTAKSEPSGPESQDDHHFVLDPAELAFLKQQTQMEDDEALKAHVLGLQKKAYEVYPYPCIRRLGFARLKINKNRAAYEHVLELGKTPGFILLDIGCCFGNDLRKIASDGFPVENTIGSDLRQDFWGLGHELFRSTPESFPVVFVAGDAFDPDFLAPPTQEPQSEPVSATSGLDLRAVKSLNALRGRLSAIHSASLFHLFSEAQQLELARRLAGLLSPRAGSMIFGCHGAHPTKGYTLSAAGKHMFCHSPESWAVMWVGDGGVFEVGSVEVKSVLRNVGKVLNADTDFYLLFWSVKRL